MNGWKLSHYRKARADGIPARRAMEYATVRDSFDNEQNNGRARLVAIPDDCAQSLDDFCPPVGPGDNARAVAAQRKACERMLERDGVWGIAAQVVREGAEERADVERDAHDSGNWETVDSLWGILGDPFDKSSGMEYDYATDLRAAALDFLAKRDSDAQTLRGDVEAVREYVACNGDVAAAFARIVARLEGGS